MADKPKSFEELKALVESGMITIQLSEDCEDGTTHLLVLDNRQDCHNEVYELWV